jgi:hypothetical protein
MTKVETQRAFGESAVVAFYRVFGRRLARRQHERQPGRRGTFEDAAAAG